MIAIVDYGSGNLASVLNMLKKLSVPAFITSSATELENAHKVILPGVGSFDTGMQNLHQYGLVDVLNKKAVEQKVPVLGICLGMQLMCNKSEEGVSQGLGWVDADVKRFPAMIDDRKLRIPHIGWSTVQVRKNTGLLNPDEENRFYFVHSYYVSPAMDTHIMTESTYGITFCSSFQRENIWGVQFHPEKSHRYGMNLLTKFASL